MDESKHNIIYEIVNTVNGKNYIGKHRTNNLDDGYMGSGVALKHAFDKYGLEKFSKRILFDFATDKEMTKKESEIVNEQFILKSTNYNLHLGGFGGPLAHSDLTKKKISLSHKNRTEECKEKIKAKSRATNLVRYGADHPQKNNHKRKEMLQKAKETMLENHGVEHYMKIKTNSLAQARLREETMLEKYGFKYASAVPHIQKKMQKKRVETIKRNGSLSGKNNPQYGKMWITDGCHSKTIYKYDAIPNGWYKGRVINKGII